MEHQSFDVFNRFLRGAPSGSTTRRALARLLVGLALGGPLVLKGMTAGEAKRKKLCGPCKRRKNGKCKPTAAGTPCAGGACQGGVCVAAAAPTAAPTPAVLTPISCPGPRAGTLSAGGRRLAQTFTANGNGTIRTAELEFDFIPEGTDFLFEIRTVDAAGIPTATVLADDERSNLPASPSGTRVTAQFIPPLPVTANTIYALVLTNVSSDGFFMNTLDGSCAGGVFFEAKGKFVPIEGVDLVFTVAP